jgi:putative Mg2+ transporter-C (MgtC) family protein
MKDALLLASDMVPHLIEAIIAGGLIGLERTYTGRSAGFRTMALVAFTSALIINLCSFPSFWHGTGQTISLMDPSRVVQGLLAGVGFIGGGVIIKDGANVRGLTTAATIWAVSAIGVLFGLGQYITGGLATLITFCVLVAFLKIEKMLPKHQHMQGVVAFSKGEVLSQQELTKLLEGEAMQVADIAYAGNQGADIFEYRMVLSTTDSKAAPRLAERFARMPNVKTFSLVPSRE